MNISDEAVEAAAKAAYEFQYSSLEGEWEWASQPVQEDYRSQSRSALEAAASHMLAPLVADLDRWAGRSKTGFYDEAQDDVAQILTPYRSRP